MIRLNASQRSHFSPPLVPLDTIWSIKSHCLWYFNSSLLFLCDFGCFQCIFSLRAYRGNHLGARHLSYQNLTSAVMPSTWKQCTHIFINTLTWYYARSIFPRPINTNWEHNWWYLMLCRWYFSAFRWIWVYFGFACVPSRLRTDTPQGNIEMGTELTQDLLWNWTCVASALIDRWFHVGNFPAVCECLALHDISRKPNSTNHLNTSTWFGHIGVNL